MTDLDVILHDALVTDAARAPHLPDEWVGPTTATVVPIDRHRRSPLLPIVGGIAAASLLVAGLALLTRPRDVTPAASEPAPPTTTIGWIPEGEEFPLVDLGPASEVPDGPVVAALTRRLQAADLAPVIMTTSLAYDGAETAHLNRCLWMSERGGGSCVPEWNPSEWVDGSTDGEESDLWVFSGLPENAAFVTFVHDGDQRWQRPVSRTVVMPGEIDGVEFTALDAEGEVVMRFDRAAQVAEQARIAESITPPLMADISQETYEQLQGVVRTSLEECLVGLGGSIDDGVATFADGIDQPAMWDLCVPVAKGAVEAVLTGLTPRFFDPAAGERPENPDSPWSFESVSE